MAMKVVTPVPVTPAAIVMRAAHALAWRWMSEFALVGEYQDVLRSAMRFAWDCCKGKAGVARLPAFAAATPRVWRNVIVSVILGVKASRVTSSSRDTLDWRVEGGEFFRLGWVPIWKIPSLLTAEAVGYVYCAATGRAGVAWI